MKTLLKILLAAALLLAQGGKDIPIYEGDNNPRHDGQPKFCQNKEANGYKANCSCENAKLCEHPHGDDKCKTHCRRSACKCAPNCMPTGR